MNTEQYQGNILHHLNGVTGVRNFIERVALTQPAIPF